MKKITVEIQIKIKNKWINFKGPFKNKKDIQHCLNAYNAIWERIAENGGPSFRLLKNGKILSRTTSKKFYLFIEE